MNTPFTHNETVTISLERYEELKQYERKYANKDSFRQSMEYRAIEKYLIDNNLFLQVPEQAKPQVIKNPLTP